MKIGLLDLFRLTLEFAVRVTRFQKTVTKPGTNIFLSLLSLIDGLYFLGYPA